MGPQPSKMGPLPVELPIGSPKMHVRSRDTLFVVSRLLESQSNDARRKELEITELRAELSRLQDAQSRLAGIVRDTERLLETEQVKNVKLRKEIIKKDDMLARVTGSTDRYRSIDDDDVYLRNISDICKTPILSRDNSIASEDLLSRATLESDDDSSDNEAADNYDPVYNNTVQEMAMVVDHLKAQLAKLRANWEEIWVSREESGEDPHLPEYADDLTTSYKCQSAAQIQRDIGRLNRQLITMRFLERLNVMKSELQTPHKQELYRRLTRQTRVNFDSPHARTIQVSLTRFITQLMQRVVVHDKRFVGKLLGVGSYHDNTKMGDPDEMDFLYIMLHPSLAKSRIKLVGPDTYEIVPTLSETTGDDWSELLHDDKLEIYVSFTRKVEAVLTEIPLPRGISYGGIDAPKSSGIRKNRPAVTINFQCRGRPVSVDISAAIIAPEEISSGVVRRMPLHVRHRAENSVTPTSKRLASISQMILLVQAGGFGQWKATTSALEVHLLQSMRFNSQLLKLITLLKYVNDKLMAIHPVAITDYLKERCWNAQGHIVNALCDQNLLTLMNKLWRRQDHESLVLFYLALRDMTDADTMYRKKVQLEWKEKLLARPSTFQTYIHPSLQALAGEKTLSLVSSSSCIFKYMVIGLYVHNKMPFMSEDSYQLDTSILVDILKQYNKAVKKKDAYDCDCGTVQHPFLRFDIAIRTIRNHTVESLSGVHDLSCDSLGSLHTWMTQRCRRVVREHLGKGDTAIYGTTHDDEPIYEEIHEGVRL